MDQMQLTYFLKIYETGSILRASQALNISQPSLSKRLRRLEDELGVLLFERTTSGVVTTLYGEALAKHAKLVQAEVESIRAEITELRNANIGKAHIGVSPVVMGGLMPAITNKLWADRPEFRFTITEAIPDALISLVRNGDLELAICTAVPIDGEPELIMEEVFQDFHVIAAGIRHPLARHGRASLGELSRHPWILTPNSGVVRRWFESKFILAGCTPPVPVVETPSILHISRVLDGGKFLSFMSLNEIKGDIQSGRIRTINAPEFAMRRTISAVYRNKGSLSPGARLIADSAREVACQLTKSQAFPTESVQNAGP